MRNLWFVMRCVLWFIWRRDSESAACLSIVLSGFMTDKDVKQLAEYYDSCRQSREWRRRERDTSHH